MTDNSSPIACNLSGPQSSIKRDKYRHDLLPYLINSTHAAGTSQLIFSKPDVTRRMLENLIALEHECCTFLEFDISETATHFHLCIGGPTGSEEMIRNFFSSSGEASAQACSCAAADKPRMTKTKKYVAGFITLCAIGCAIPPALAAAGLIGVAMGTFIGKGIEAALISLALMGLGFILVQFVRKRRRGVSS